MQVFYRLLTRVCFLVIFLIPVFRSHAQMPGLVPNHLQIPPGNFEVNLQWMGDSLNGTWEPHAYLLLPVKLKGCPRQFFMQFDLGAPSSMFYSGKIRAIRDRYPDAIPVEDSQRVLKNFSFQVGKVPITCKEIIIRPGKAATINWNSRKVFEVIGTIGSDLIDKHVAVFDYPRLRLSISEVMPMKYSTGVAMGDFMYVQRSVILPAFVGTKKTMLYFDTGSSAFELLTSEAIAKSMAVPGSQPFKHNSGSWESVMTANTYPVVDTITMASVKLPLHHVTFMQGVSDSQIERMMKMGIGGMTGNKLFINSILVLDTKNKKFGVISKPVK